MSTYNQMDQSDKKIAYIAVAIYALLLIVCVLVFKFTIKDSFAEYPPKTGILVALGDMVEGRGDELLQKTVTEDRQVTTPAVNPSPNTQAVEQNIPNPSNTPTQIKENDKAPDGVLNTSSAKPKPKKEVNKSALYQSNNGSTAQSIGEKTGQGTMGSINGDPNSDNHTITDGFSLDGRSIIGSLPRPTYSSNNEGIVVIDIQVDQEGVVTSAAFKVQGSTTSDSKLVAEAISAAKKARFNRDASARFVQTGTITYTFKVR